MSIRLALPFLLIVILGGRLIFVSDELARLKARPCVVALDDQTIGVTSVGSPIRVIPGADRR